MSQHYRPRTRGRWLLSLLLQPPPPRCRSSRHSTRGHSSPSPPCTQTHRHRTQSAPRTPGPRQCSAHASRTRRPHTPSAQRTACPATRRTPASGIPQHRTCCMCCTPSAMLPCTLQTRIHRCCTRRSPRKQQATSPCMGSPASALRPHTTHTDCTRGCSSPSAPPPPTHLLRTRVVQRTPGRSKSSLQPSHTRCLCIRAAPGTCQVLTPP